MVSSSNDGVYTFSINSQDDPNGVSDAILVFTYDEGKPIGMYKIDTRDPISSLSFVQLIYCPKNSILIMSKHGFLQFLTSRKFKPQKVASLADRMDKLMISEEASMKTIDEALPPLESKIQSAVD